ncbi:hypothetical protein ABZ511_09500 [Nocardia gamkensis]|uniref:hypothetical protein n=1 Tax=Nocardia gamkensis TaxID=352869 RepID=UPI0033D381ED
MGDDSTQSLRPMTNVLNAAREGQLGIQMSAEDFVYIDRDCEYFKIAIRSIQRSMDFVSRQPHWGLGEGNDDLVSGKTLVDRFKEKARGAKDLNSVHQIMEDHYRIVEDIQEVHRLARDRIMQADSDFAADFNRLNATLPERPPAGVQFAPPRLPIGTNE